jgi:hypothetical protein
MQGLRRLPTEGKQLRVATGIHVVAKGLFVQAP